MGRVFLSYRREDSLDVTGRIFDRLSAHFGRDSVFMDVDTIPFGVDFRAHFASWIESCDVVLVVIGEAWIDVAYTDGAKVDTRRLDDPADFVRIEVGTALARDVPVVPVLVGRATMPSSDELPDDLESLAFRNAAEVRSGRDFHIHMDRLIRDIERSLELPAPILEPAPSAVEPIAEPDPASVPEELTLADVLARRVPIPEPIALHIVVRAVDQLDIDEPQLDPRKVVLGPPTSEPTPRLVETARGASPGDYGAPRPDVGERSSAVVYAAGQILWELLMGRAAFTGTASRIREAKRRQAHPLKMSQAAYDTPLAVQHLIARATEPHPDKRATVLELMELAAQITPAIDPPSVVAATNLGFAGDVVAGFPHGWFDGFGCVLGVSTAYDFRVDDGDDRRCVRVFRRGAGAPEFGSLTQRIPAGHLSTRTVRVSADVRTELVDDGWAGLWLRADGPQRVGRSGFHRDVVLHFENMNERPITGTTEWTRHEIVTSLPAGVQWLNYGVLHSGDGTVRIADFDLEVRTYDGRWQSLAWDKLTSFRADCRPRE